MPFPLCHTPNKRQWHYVCTLYVWVKRFAGVQRGLSLKAPSGASPRQNDNICGARLTKGCLCDIIIFNTKQKKGAVEHRRYILVGSLSAVGTDKQPGGSEKNARVGNACACGRNPRVSGGSGQRNGRTSGVQPRRGGTDIGDSPRVLHAAGSSYFRRGTSKLHSQTADGAEGALSHSAAERGTERFSEAL